MRTAKPMFQKLLCCEFETKEAKEETAAFSGVASTSDIDSHCDIIEAGAFDPIAKRANGEPDVAMFRDHDRSQVVGGWRSVKQQGQQLIVEGELVLEVEKARETYALLKRGYLSGLSVGFNIPDRTGIKYDDKNGRRIIKKATLKECSIVSMPANINARVLNVKSELASCGLSDEEVDVLMNEGLDALIEQRKAESAGGYGDVPHADPGYQEDKKKRYPIDTEAHIRAAWNRIHQGKNRGFYSADQLSKIEGRIISAWKNKIDSAGPPAAEKEDDEDWLPSLGTAINEARVTHELRGLLTQLKGRVHV